MHSLGFPKYISMGARPIEHGRKVGTKAKQILPMLSTVTANIPHKALFPLHLQLIYKKKKSGLREFHSHWKKKVKLFHKRARSPHYNPRGIPFSKRKIQEHGCPSLLANKGLLQSKVKTQRIGTEKKKSQLQTTNGQTADPRRPKLVQPFFLSQRSCSCFAKAWGRGAVLSSSWPKRASERAWNPAGSCVHEIHQNKRFKSSLQCICRATDRR